MGHFMSLRKKSPSMPSDHNGRAKWSTGTGSEKQKLRKNTVLWHVWQGRTSPFSIYERESSTYPVEYVLWNVRRSIIILSCILTPFVILALTGLRIFPPAGIRAYVRVGHLASELAGHIAPLHIEGGESYKKKKIRSKNPCHAPKIEWKAFLP